MRKKGDFTMYYEIHVDVQYKFLYSYYRKDNVLLFVIFCRDHITVHMMAVVNLSLDHTI